MAILAISNDFRREAAVDILQCGFLSLTDPAPPLEFVLPQKLLATFEKGGAFGEDLRVRVQPMEKRNRIGRAPP